MQKLVPAERDSPAVVMDPNDTFTLPGGAASSRAATTPPPTATSPTPPATPAPTATPSPTPSPTPATRPALTVLNNSRVNGLAARAASDFAAGGWRIAGTGNLRGRTPQTTVYYAPEHAEAAAALRRQFPKIRDAQPRYAGLPGDGGLTVVVTRDYAS
ncbi:MAG TPA: LytR C-terminal domain-containing protein [Frankiaceae bacterium]|nr:LytR C-terminal domain-containing protein [Frankiaceae bacterium]